MDYSKWDRMDFSDSDEDMDDRQQQPKGGRDFLTARTETLLDKAAEANAPRAPPTTALPCACIFLHGSGDTGPGIREWLRRASDFEERLAARNVKCLFPSATPRASSTRCLQTARCGLETLRLPARTTSCQ